MDIILFLLYLSLYLSLGSIMAELLLGNHDKEQLNIVVNRKSVYFLITAIWPLCIIIILYRSFTWRA